MKKVHVALLFLATLAISCSTTKEKIPPMPVSDKPEGKMIIYQLLPRLFGNKTMVNKTYGTIEENGVGKFNDIDDAALEAIKQLGVSHIWYTGVIEHALITDYSKFGIPKDNPDVVKGRAGSPYAIKDYYDVDPDLAVDVPNRMKEFDELVARTHAHNMHVIIDFVPNHVAREYHSDVKPDNVKDLGESDDNTVSFKANNNFYYLPETTFKVPSEYHSLRQEEDPAYEESPAKATGNNKFVPNPDVNDWFETVKLNYGVDIQGEGKTYFDPVPDTWNKMRDILLYWTNKKVDGFRCDMAEMVPVEFWGWVIPQVKAVNANIIFIAEVYNPDEYHNYIEKGKFDFLYDKSLLYDNLRLMMKGERSTIEIANIQKRLSGINDHMLHFMENHDEQRIASQSFAGDMWKGAPAMVISATIDQGPMMIYSGQEVGEPALGVEGFQGDDGRTTIFDYWGVPQHQKWMNDGKFDGGKLDAENKQLRMLHADVLNLAATSPAFTKGEYVDITEFNVKAGNFPENTHAFIRVSGHDRYLVINGFNNEDQDVSVQLSPEAVKALNFKKDEAYIAHDMLWKEVEAGFDKDWAFSFKMKPHICLMLKIK